MELAVLADLWTDLRTRLKAQSGTSRGSQVRLLQDIYTMLDMTDLVMAYPLRKKATGTIANGTASAIYVPTPPVDELWVIRDVWGDAGSAANPGAKYLYLTTTPPGALNFYHHLVDSVAGTRYLHWTGKLVQRGGWATSDEDRVQLYVDNSSGVAGADAILTVIGERYKLPALPNPGA